MKKERITPAVRASAAFGYEVGFRQALSYMNEAVSRLDGDPEMKLLAQSALGSIEEFGQEDKEKFVKALQFEIAADGSVTFS